MAGSSSDTIDDIKAFIEREQLSITEWEFAADNPENPYITIWFNGNDDNVKAKTQDKGDIPSGSDSNSSSDGSWEEMYASSAYNHNGIVGRKFDTYGGGPSGGYIHSVDEGMLYSWNQEWFEPEVLTQLPGKKLDFRIDPYPGGKSIEYLKVVDISPDQQPVRASVLCD